MKKKLIKATAKILSASILTQSCGGDSVLMNGGAEHINEEWIHLRPFDSTIVPLELGLEKSAVRYTDFLAKLAHDIVGDPVVARSFSADPNKMIEAYGVEDLKISLDDELLQLIIAMGDEEIVSSIREKNISKYLRLCREKGLFDRFSMSEHFSPLLRDLNSSVNQVGSLVTRSNEDSSVVAVAAAVLVGVVAVIWAVAVTHVGAMNVVDVATAVHVSAAISTVTIASGEEAKSQEIRNLMNSRVLKIWNMQSADSNTTIAVAEAYIEQLANQCINAIKENFPQVYEKYGEDYLKNNIIINIE